MILYVVRYHPALTETFVRDEAAALHHAGVELELAAFDARDDVELPEPPHPVHAQPHRWGWLTQLPTLAREWLRRPAWVSPRVLWLAAVARRARRIHVHFAGEAAEWARLAAARVGIPYTVTVHAVDLYKPAPSLPTVLREAERVVAMTEFNATLLRARFGVHPTLLRFGLDLGALPARRRAVPPRVVAVGRNVPKKGLDLLVAMAPRLPAEVRLVSNHPGGPGFFSTGLLPHTEALAEVAAAAVFVLPCRVAPDGDMDGLPVALVEAMAMGVPVVSTRVSGIPELLDDEVGWCVEPEDVGALEAAIREALAQPEEAERRGAAAAARVRARGYGRDSLTAGLRRVFGLG